MDLGGPLLKGLGEVELQVLHLWAGGSLPGRHFTGEEIVQHLLDVGAQGEGAFHLQPGPEEHLVDRALIRRIGHRQRHLPAGLQDGQHAVLSQEGLGEEPRDPWVDDVWGRVNVRVPQLVAERPGDIVFGHMLLLHQNLADPHAGRRLRGHGPRQLLGGDEPVRDQDLPELVGLLLLGARRRLSLLAISRGARRQSNLPASSRQPA